MINKAIEHSSKCNTRFFNMERLNVLVTNDGEQFV